MLKEESMGESRHTCICLCSRCERQGAGAFGVQPDGAEPIWLEAARAAQTLVEGRRAASSDPREL